jgi:hypothetical protein
MSITPGSRWASTVSSIEVVVVRPGAGVTALTCGDAPMVPAGTTAPGTTAPGTTAPGTTAPVNGEGCQLGKRYVDETTGLQLLCTKPGNGVVAVDGRPVQLLAAKPLPASD